MQDPGLAAEAEALAAVMKLPGGRVDRAPAGGSPFYDPATRTLRLPDDLVERLRRDLDRHAYGPQAGRDAAARDLALFVLAHELAHAGHDLLKLPDGEIEADRTAAQTLRKAFPRRADAAIRTAIDYLNLCATPGDVKRAKALAAPM
ncbi:MAG: DUF4344 domain-containing metallopeptidase [Kiritimatiellia bacterium]